MISIYRILLLISFICVILILRQNQTKSMIFLLVTCMGSLIMNTANVFLSTCTNQDTALVIYRFYFMGHSTFIVFFIWFLASHLNLRIPRFLLNIFTALEFMSTVLCGNEKTTHLFMNSFELVVNVNGSNYITRNLAILGIIRFILLIVYLSSFTYFSLLKTKKATIKTERFNDLVLNVALLLVFGSTFSKLFVDLSFDVVALVATITNGFITYLASQGNFYTIGERGLEVSADSMNGSLIIVDNKYRFVYANKYSQGVFPELASLELGEILPDYLSAELQSPDLSFTYKGRQYEKKPVDIANQKEVLGYSFVIEDITDRIGLLNELVEAKDKAEEADKAKSDFLSNMSHEIRNPMNAISTAAQVLLRTDINDEYMHFVDIIHSSSENLIAIVDDILDFSKAEQGEIQLHEVQFETVSILDDLSIIFLNKLGEKPVELIYDIDPCLPKSYYGDPQRIKQVISNIVSNAIKFTNKGYVKLVIRVEQLDDGFDEVSFLVRDTGIGIKEEEMNKLFKAFSLINTKKNHETEGLGIGLKISKQLVEMMNGTIGCRSVYGECSEFFFDLKLKRMNSERAAILKNKEDGTPYNVSYLFDNLALVETLNELCAINKVKVIEVDELADQHLDIFFTDTTTFRQNHDTFMNYAKGNTTKVVVMQNPVKETIWEKGVLSVNMPLSNVNFIRVLNNESLDLFKVNEGTFNFIAPTAHILVVDDNTMNLEVAEALLEPLQMKVDVADSGKKALEMIRTSSYDLVFMDHMMPGMDGIETTDIIRSWPGEYYQHLVIIALSANNVLGAREEFIAHGLNDFIPKPIEVKRMITALRTWLPPQKITNCEVSVRKEEEKIEPIIGLDVEEGVKNSGGSKLFYKLLGDYHALIDHKCELIRTHLNNEDLKEYRVEVHGLKSTSRMIGALDLSSMFKDLEDKARNEDLAYLKKHTEDVLANYCLYKEYLKPYSSVVAEKKKIEDEELIEILLNLKDAADVMDIDTIDNLMKYLEGVEMKKDLEVNFTDLRTAVSNLADEDIMSLCEIMIKSLQGGEQG